MLLLLILLRALGASLFSLLFLLLALKHFHVHILQTESWVVVVVRLCTWTTRRACLMPVLSRPLCTVVYVTCLFQALNSCKELHYLLSERSFNQQLFRKELTCHLVVPYDWDSILTLWPALVFLVLCSTFTFFRSTSAMNGIADFVLNNSGQQKEKKL